MFKKITAISLLLILTFTCKAQESPAINSFKRFVLKNYRLPDELKSNCGWMYAIVKVETDNSNKIVKYKIVNPSNRLEGTFNFIIGYQFPKKMKINAHPIVFYMGIDNLDGCEEKPGDKVYYAPNEPASAIWSYMNMLIKEDRQTIFISDMLFYGYGKPQP
jgi:hypothetical protein